MHRIFAAGIAVMALGGCNYAFDLRAETAYGEGRYLETAERLERHEPELARLGPVRQARYGLYRGLASLKLGDREAARRWLSYTRDREERRMRLSVEQRRKLELGWAEVEGHPAARVPLR
jgi:hypothetical protein